MKLSREQGHDRRIATAAEIEEGLRDLGASAGGFAVLERGDGAFAQAFGDRAAGFVLEVREGDVHLQSRRRDLSKDEVLALLTSWLEGDERWRGAVEWGPGPTDPASGSAGGRVRATYRHALVALAIAAVLGGAGEAIRRLSPGTLAAWLYAVAGLLALFAARIAFDVARRERAAGAPPRNRMMRG